MTSPTLVPPSVLLIVSISTSFSKWTTTQQNILVAIARSAALVLHTDVIFILLPVCRNFISLLRRTPLNQFIPFDKNITFHKATAWSMVVFTVIHVGAHMRNFQELAMLDPNAKTTTQRILVFLRANFATGPGATGWIMTACLGVMVWFAREKRRRANFERFWYSHHLFLIFFLAWQFHGLWCMIKPDRQPFCSYNTIGVFWVSSTFTSVPHFSSYMFSATGLLVAPFGPMSVSYVKFGLVTIRTSLKSSSTLQRSLRSRSRRRRRRLVPDNTSSFPAQKSRISNGILSLLPGMSFLAYP